MLGDPVSDKKVSDLSLSQWKLQLNSIEKAYAFLLIQKKDGMATSSFLLQVPLPENLFCSGVAVIELGLLVITPLLSFLDYQKPLLRLIMLVRSI